MSPLRLSCDIDRIVRLRWCLSGFGFRWIRFSFNATFAPIGTYILFRDGVPCCDVGFSGR